MRTMKQLALMSLTWGLCGCEAAPPPAPEPELDSLEADISEISKELLACEQRENDRLRAELTALDVDIAKARQEAAELLLTSGPNRKPKRKP